MTNRLPVDLVNRVHFCFFSSQYHLDCRWRDCKASFIKKFDNFVKFDLQCFITLPCPGWFPYCYVVCKNRTLNFSKEISNWGHNQIKSMGLSAPPCGTPIVISRGCDKWELVFAMTCLSWRYDEIICSIRPLIPFSMRLHRITSCGTQSKAFMRSRKMAVVLSPFSNLSSKSVTSSARLSWVERPLL